MFTAHIFETIVLLGMQMYRACNMFIQKRKEECFLCEHLQVSIGNLQTIHFPTNSFFKKFFNDSYIFLRLYQELTKPNFVTTFLQEKHMKEIKVHKSGPIAGLLLNFLHDLKIQRSRHPSVPNPPYFSPYTCHLLFHC